MPLEIPVPNSANSEVTVSLDGVEYLLQYTFNSRDERYRLSIFNTNGESIITGLKIMESQNLTGNYRINGFTDGDIYCVKIKNTNNPVGRNNLGFNKEYSLVYLSDSEEI